MNRNKIKAHLLLTGLILLTAVLQGVSQDSKNGLFPEMKDWQLKQGDQVYNSGNLWNIINGAADAYLSYDFHRLYTAEYTQGEDRHIKVYIFEHSSPVNAFGIYSQERSNDYTFVQTGAQGFKSGDAYYFIKGPYYVQISTNDAGLSEQLETLAGLMDEKIHGSDRLPQTLELFPQDGLMPHSQKYIAANFLGYSYMHSAFVAEYQHEGEGFRMFIIHPDDAGDLQTMLNEYFDFVEYPGESRNKEILHIEDPYNGDIWVYKNNQYLAGVMTKDETLARHYIDLLRQSLE